MTFPINNAFTVTLLGNHLLPSRIVMPGQEVGVTFFDGKGMSGKLADIEIREDNSSFALIMTEDGSMPEPMRPGDVVDGTAPVCKGNDPTCDCGVQPCFASEPVTGDADDDDTRALVRDLTERLRAMTASRDEHQEAKVTLSRVLDEKRSIIRSQHEELTRRQTELMRMAEDMAELRAQLNASEEKAAEWQADSTRRQAQQRVSEDMSISSPREPWFVINHGWTTDGVTFSWDAAHVNETPRPRVIVQSDSNGTTTITIGG